ncbi:MAG: aldehyde ferredoxin oxidoreductase C-terminal domain-containing protein [Candidatus Latescibacterota bacterium]
MAQVRTGSPTQITDFTYTRAAFDLGAGRLLGLEVRPVRDDMEFLGGIGRSYPLVAQHPVSDPYGPEAVLVVNTGCLTGTAYMTGLRAYFTAYSPLKRTLAGVPMPAWSAMSGSFGRKLRSTGLDDLLLQGRAAGPSILVVRQTPGGPSLTLEEAPAQLVGARVSQKMAWLDQRYNDRTGRRFPAHFAVIGPAGEHWQTVWYAGIAGSTQEQVMTGEDKFRFAGRLGMGSVLGSKNVLALVAYAPEDVYPRGDERLKEVNRQVGRGDQSKGYRHPSNFDGGGGTGRLERVLDSHGVMPYRNFEPRGEMLSVPTHLETVRESAEFTVIDKNCYGCQIACHQEVYETPPEGKDPDPRRARRHHGPYVGRFEFEPMELSGPNLGITEARVNLDLARHIDELGLDAISTGVVVSFLMDHNERRAEPLARGVRFGSIAGVRELLEDIAYGREPLYGKGVKAIAEQLGGGAFAMHCKGVEHSAYLPQTNPGYPFAVAGGHMSMRTFLLYVMDTQCQPDSADYWVRQIGREGWKMIAANLHGGCLFAWSPPQQVVTAIAAIYGVGMSAERLLEATYRAYLLGFAMEQRQGATVADYDLAEEVFTGGRKGDLPAVHFLSRPLFEEIRQRVLAQFEADARRYGFL